MISSPWLVKEGQTWSTRKTARQVITALLATKRSAHAATEKGMLICVLSTEHGIKVGLHVAVAQWSPSIRGLKSTRSPRRAVMLGGRRDPTGQRSQLTGRRALKWIWMWISISKILRCIEQENYSIDLEFNYGWFSRSPIRFLHYGMVGSPIRLRPAPRPGHI